MSSSPAQPRHPAPRPGRVLRIVLVTLAVVTLGVGAVGAIGWCSVFGCTWFSEDFEPWGEEATEARAAAVPEAARLADGAAAAGRVVADASRDGCRTGQNDWKRKDTYSHECEVEQSRIVLVTTRVEEVEDGLTRLDAAIRGLGCEASLRGGLDRVRDEYWLAANPQVQQRGADGLPSARYDCGSGSEVEVEPTSARASAASLGFVMNSNLWVDELLAEDWYTPQDLRALRETDAVLAVVVTASDGYYRTRF